MVVESVSVQRSMVAGTSAGMREGGRLDGSADGVELCVGEVAPLPSVLIVGWGDGFGRVGVKRRSHRAVKAASEVVCSLDRLTPTPCVRGGLGHGVDDGDGGDLLGNHWVRHVSLQLQGGPE